MESAGIRFYRKCSGPDRWHNPPGVDRVVADKGRPIARAWNGSPLGFEERELSRYL